LLVVVHGRWSKVVLVQTMRIAGLEYTPQIGRGRIARLCGDLVAVERQHSEFPFA
jgi:hypothetical protein